MRLAGLLHDVGKIGIPDAILTKPSALTEAEYEQMKRHSILGEEIVAAAGLTTEARWIRHHHERYDGAGYPEGLAGEDIPLQSRIILTADAFEAMTSDRPYRKAPGRDFALAELDRHAGTQFDPQIVCAFTRTIQSTPIPVAHSDPIAGAAGRAPPPRSVRRTGGRSSRSTKRPPVLQSQPLIVASRRVARGAVGGIRARGDSGRRTDRDFTLHLWGNPHKVLAGCQNLIRWRDRDSNPPDDVPGHGRTPEPDPMARPGLEPSGRRPGSRPDART